MGEGYDWVNVDKREYLDPVDFDMGYKLHESMWTGDRFFPKNHLLGALYALLATDWKDDQIIFLGDETTITEHDTNPVLQKILTQERQYGQPAHFTYDLCKDISGLFKAAEAEVRADIQSMIEYGAFETNYYKVDLNAPFDGLFTRDSIFFRYTMNHTKKEFYDMGKYYVNGFTDSSNPIPRFNPLPVLMAFGKKAIHKYDGCWLGDHIGVSNAPPPQTYKNMSETYLTMDW